LERYPAQVAFLAHTISESLNRKQALARKDQRIQVLHEHGFEETALQNLHFLPRQQKATLENSSTLQDEA
jgi:hypothetical protein